MADRSGRRQVEEEVETCRPAKQQSGQCKSAQARSQFSHAQQLRSFVHEPYLTPSFGAHP